MIVIIFIPSNQTYQNDIEILIFDANGFFSMAGDYVIILFLCILQHKDQIEIHSYMSTYVYIYIYILLYHRICSIQNV